MPLLEPGPVIGLVESIDREKSSRAATWLKKDGSGYQTRINAILLAYMNAQSEARR
jgi:BrnA antitoxin of type II toxin-antitoxin system